MLYYEDVPCLLCIYKVYVSLLSLNMLSSVLVKFDVEVPPGCTGAAALLLLLCINL
jgi:hypothetical protein